MKDYDYTPLYYSTPCPVRYYFRGTFVLGTGFEDQIIAQDGKTKFLIEDIIDAARQDGIHFDDAIVERNKYNGAN